MADGIFTVIGSVFMLSCEVRHPEERLILHDLSGGSDVRF
eukprot:gene30721-37121_t